MDVDMFKKHAKEVHGNMTSFRVFFTHVAGMVYSSHIAKKGKVVYTAAWLCARVTNWRYVGRLIISLYIIVLIQGRVTGTQLRFLCHLTSHHHCPPAPTVASAIHTPSLPPRLTPFHDGHVCLGA